MCVHMLVLIIIVHPCIPCPNVTVTNEPHARASCDYTKHGLLLCPLCGLVYTAILDYVKECCGELISITMWTIVYTAVTNQL